MDSCMIDISEIEASEGDLVEIFGQNLSVVEIADKINTIPYEIYSTLNRRIKRIYSLTIKYLYINNKRTLVMIDRCIKLNKLSFLNYYISCKL